MYDPSKNSYFNRIAVHLYWKEILNLSKSVLIQTEILEEIPESDWRIIVEEALGESDSEVVKATLLTMDYCMTFVDPIYEWIARGLKADGDREAVGEELRKILRFIVVEGWILKSI